MNIPARTDVLVVGGGNAAMCAAITARRRGSKISRMACIPATHPFFIRLETAARDYDCARLNAV